jgi:tRNA(His) 5'-end guanylyltransferase
MKEIKKTKKTSKDSLGDRMKAYEAVTQTVLPRRTYAILRLDGRAFHSLVKKIKAEKPFDMRLIDLMNRTAQFLCQNIQGAQFAYVQSDEISILLTDFEKVDTQSWFGGNVQKMVSISAAMATSFFQTKLFYGSGFDLSKSWDDGAPFAMFDSRVFVIPDPVEVYNCFLWRTRDWERNSIQMLARSNYSHKELQGKGRSDMHEMLHKKDKNWAKLPDDIKRGRLIKRNAEGGWETVPMFKFPEQKEELQNLIPTPGYE